ncbi:MAG: endonuclease/exonuclease/phosphatase family protein [Clostridia bacterium]|nr:endonuclease/exonuclease/phosphatase family protein [Clostridia bacterium]
MKIMTFNTQSCLNYLEQKVDYDIMAKTILDLGAEVVGLNEMHSYCEEGDTFPNQTKTLADLCGFENHYFARAVCLPPEGSFGNGLISKYKIVKAETIAIPDPNPRKYNGYYETRCILKAKLENGLTVMSVHFGLNPDEHENAVKTILENLENEKCVLMGDFNITPDNELLNKIREKMKDTAVGYCENTPTWPSDKPEMKIDYIFVTPDIEVVSAEIPEIIASDHRAHTAEIIF